MSFEVDRLRRPDWIIGTGAVALLIFTFFFKWFGISLPGVVSAYISAVGVSTSANAWHSMEVIRFLLVLTLLVGAALVTLNGLGRKLELPLSLSVIVAGLGALSTILVFYRVIVSHPFSHADVKVGAYLGLLSCAAIAYGGYLAMTGEGTSLSDVRDQASRAVSGLADAHSSPTATDGAGASTPLPSSDTAPAVEVAEPPPPPSVQPSAERSFGGGSQEAPEPPYAGI